MQRIVCSANQNPETVEYRLISNEYKDRCAARSKVPLINHINEGLIILDRIGASDDARRAYCLHPLLQNDVDLQKNFDAALHLISIENDDGWPSLRSMLLAMEYRNVANAYLAACAMPAAGIRLSPLPEVNDMLIADKVQNRKDFERYHMDTHPNAGRLTDYFHEWCRALGISHEKYVELTRDL